MSNGFLNIPKNFIKAEDKRLILIPVTKELQGQIAITAKGVGLGILKPKLFTVDAARMADEDSVNEPGVGIYNYDKTSIFGTPVFDVVTLENVDWTDFNGVSNLAEDLVLDIAIVEVDMPRNIVRTPISGRNGTVKEYMSDGDYEIKITGSLVNKLATIPPEALVRMLHAHCMAQKETSVTSTLLSFFNIYSIVITNARFMQRVGARNVIDYELQCVSETPFELKQDA